MITRLHAPPGIEVVTRGEANEEVHYLINRDGSLDVQDDDVDDFIIMGFAHETLRTEQPAPATSRDRQTSRPA